MLSLQQISLVFFLAQPIQKVVFLCRLPARPVWSTGVPRPNGSAAATSESERDEQPARNSGAKHDGLLPNNVFLSGAHPRHGNLGYKVAFESVESVGLSVYQVVDCVVGARHSYY